MMWAIFCSLAFCTFQIVFADTQNDIDVSQDALILEFNGVHDEAYTDVSAAAQAVKIKKMKWLQVFEKCTSTDYGQRFAKSYGDKLPICDQCYLKVKNTKDIQTAEKCFKKQLAKFKKDAKLFGAQAKTCISKCAQDPAKCLEEHKNIEKKDRKEFENASEGDTTNV